jgi:hypothetical protein
MSNTIFLVFIFGVILAIMLFSGLVKTTSFTFGKDPAANIYQSEDIRTTQSDKTEDVKEKNRKLMEKVQAQMEKNRR